jgi:hypothetical protein
VLLFQPGEKVFIKHPQFCTFLFSSGRRAVHPDIRRYQSRFLRL